MATSDDGDTLTDPKAPISESLLQLLERARRLKSQQNTDPIEVSATEFSLLTTEGKGSINGINNSEQEDGTFKTQCAVMDGDDKHFFVIFTDEPRHNWQS